LKSYRTILVPGHRANGQSTKDFMNRAVLLKKLGETGVELRSSQTDKAFVRLDETMEATKAMTGSNPYQAYTEGSVFNDQPLRLVVALYEGALDATRQAVSCLQARDIWGRGKAINKGIAILSELLVSLDEQKGGEIAGNLKRLYLYMQRRLIEAHSRQAAPPLLEVEKLLETMLEGWREAASNGNVQEIDSLDEVGSLDAHGREAYGPDVHSQDLPHLGLATSRAASQPAEAQLYADYLGQDTEMPAGSVFSF
jgi:flagellar protein FliS